MCVCGKSRFSLLFARLFGGERKRVNESFVSFYEFIRETIGETRGTMSREWIVNRVGNCVDFFALSFLPFLFSFSLLLLRKRRGVLLAIALCFISV